MQLTFGPDEFDAFSAVKDRLVEEFGPWAQEHYGADDGSLVADAGTFLSWRFDYSNGDLSHFTPDDVEDFLLDWAPRKFAVPPEAAPTLCRSVQAMVEFLAATGRLRGGAASAARVMVYVDDLVDEVAEALADESNFGIGKSLGAVALTDTTGKLLAGIEELLADPNLDAEQLQAALEQRMEAFNALPFEERRAHTDAALAEPPPEPSSSRSPTSHPLARTSNVRRVSRGWCSSSTGSWRSWPPRASSSPMPATSPSASPARSSMRSTRATSSTWNSPADPAAPRRAFLLEHDLATEDEVGAFVDVGPMVDLLHSMIDDPTDLDTAFNGVRGTDVLTVIEDMWRHDAPETVEVLEALGRHLTDKRLAKAARKAVIRHRSWMADEGR